MALPGEAQDAHRIRGGEVTKPADRAAKDAPAGEGELRLTAESRSVTFIPPSVMPGASQSSIADSRNRWKPH